MAPRSPIKPPRWSHSLKFRIVVSYSLILIVGGLSTSTIGIYVTGRALHQQARQQAVYGLALARAVYAQHQLDLRRTVETVAGRGWPRTALTTGDATAAAQLDQVRRALGLDLLSLVAPDGHVITGGTDAIAQIPPVLQALAGEPSVGNELIATPLEPGALVADAKQNLTTGRGAAAA